MSLSVKGLAALILGGVLLIALLGIVGGQVFSKAPDADQISSKVYSKGCFVASLSQRCAEGGNYSVDDYQDGVTSCSGYLVDGPKYNATVELLKNCEVTLDELPVEVFE